MDWSGVFFCSSSLGSLCVKDFVPDGNSGSIGHRGVNFRRKFYCESAGGLSKKRGRDEITEEIEDRARAEMGRCDAGDPSGRDEARTRRAGGAEYRAQLDVHVFLDGGDEALGGREKLRVHLHALWESNADNCRGENRGARRGGGGDCGGVRDGRDFERAARGAERRRRSYFDGAALRRNVPADARPLSTDGDSRKTRGGGPGGHRGAGDDPDALPLRGDADESVAAAGGFAARDRSGARVQADRDCGQHVRQPLAAEADCAGLRHDGAQRDEVSGRAYGPDWWRGGGIAGVDRARAREHYLFGRVHGPGGRVSADPRDEDAHPAGGAAVQDGDGSGAIPGAAPEGSASALPGAGVASGSPAGSSADAGFWRDVVV